MRLENLTFSQIVEGLWVLLTTESKIQIEILSLGYVVLAIIVLFLFVKCEKAINVKYKIANFSFGLAFFWCVGASYGLFLTWTGFEWLRDILFDTYTRIGPIGEFSRLIATLIFGVALFKTPKIIMAVAAFITFVVIPIVGLLNIMGLINV